MKRHLVFAIALFFLVASGAAEPAHSSDLDKLVPLLQQGGYVIYVRHTSTVVDQVDAETDDLSDCSKQRQLSKLGREQATRMGRGIRALEIPIGMILSSPYCRCLATAQLAFGRVEADAKLVSSVPAGEDRARDLAQALRDLLNTPPEPGTNTVLIGHMSNLKEAVGIYPKPEGAALIFEPVRGEAPKFLGVVLPDDWSERVSGD